MKKISEPSKKRLLLLAKILSQTDEKRLTSVGLSKKTGWSESTIRRDISALELHNGQTSGYDIKILKNAIYDAFQVNPLENQKHRCCIVGLGKLGEALLERAVFEESAFEMVAGFDTNFNKIEIMKSDVPLFATLDLEKKVHSLRIEYALLAVPDEKAQFMADRLVASGIKGILNYTNVILDIPENVTVENVSAVMILTGMVAEKQ